MKKDTELFSNVPGLHFSEKTKVSNVFDTNACKTTAVQLSILLYTVFSRNSNESSREKCSLLSFWNLFNEDPGHCRPACVSVSILVASVGTSNILLERR